MKYIVLVLLLLILSFSLALSANASVCRNYDGHQICILSIKRSAKKYWEYRASVSIDGVKTPIEVYNCRDRIKIQKDGTTLLFQPQAPEEMICSFFQQPSSVILNILTDSPERLS